MMKKITLATLIALCSATAFAQQTGGFNGPSAQESQAQPAAQGGFTGTTALSTVKGHNRNIFGKLQVQSRTAAVARARELGLI